MPIKVRCPSCKDAFKTSSKNRGQRVACPLCDSTIRVSEKSRKKREKKGESLNEEIAAVLAEDDGLPPREFVPSALDADEPSALEAGDSALMNGVVADLDAGVNGSTAAEEGAPVSGGPLDLSYDAIPVPDTDRPPAGLKSKRAAAPFGLGVLVGVAIASAAWMLLSAGGDAGAPPRQAAPPPRPSGPVKFADDIEPTAPPESAEEKSALLAQLSVPAAKLETGGGLLGGGRTLVFLVRNESGLVLNSVTLDATLGLAAFDDAVLAEQQVVVSFTPVLGVGEEQEVRLAAPSGPIASVELSGPVRLTARVVDLDWQE